MAVMLERWNDERMDDLAGKVDGIGVQLHEQGSELRHEVKVQGSELRQEMKVQGSELRQEMKAGFDRVDRELRDHQQEMLELRKDMKAGFERVDDRFERMGERFSRLERRITNVAIGLVGAIIVGFTTLANGPL